MSEDKDPKEPEQAPARTPGQILMTARKENNITLQYVADKLRLSGKLVEFIEADQTEGLPESTYVRGYIRSYARLLGLNEEEVLENYSADTSDEQQWTSRMPGDSGKGLVQKPRRRGIASPFTFAALLVTVGFLAWFAWDQDWFQLRQGIVTQPVVKVTGGNSSNTIAETEAARAAEAGVPTGPVLATTASSVDGEATVSTSTLAREPSATADVPPPDQEVELTFEFTDTSWVDVRDRADHRLMFKSYTNGDFESVQGLRPFRIFIGNAAAVRMTYAGREYDVMPHRNGIYAKFELGQLDVDQAASDSGPTGPNQ